jgi:hypothetical protein
MSPCALQCSVVVYQRLTYARSKIDCCAASGAIRPSAVAYNDSGIVFHGATIAALKIASARPCGCCHNRVRCDGKSSHREGNQDSAKPNDTFHICFPTDERFVGRIIRALPIATGGKPRIRYQPNARDFAMARARCSFWTEQAARWPNAVHRANAAIRHSHVHREEPRRA